jgi:predicted RNase H-like nuclease (RuvC/YqgF family)
MQPSQDPDRLSIKPDSDESEQSFEEILETVERSLQELKERHAQIEQDQPLQKELEARSQTMRSQLRQSKSSRLKLELRKIEKQLEELEFNLESRLFSWAGFKEVFWQAIRFSGLGIAVGWSLAFYTLKNPTPSTTSPTPQTLTP